MFSELRMCSFVYLHTPSESQQGAATSKINMHLAPAQFQIIF